MFCKARKLPLALQDNVTEKLKQMVREALEPVQPGGITKALSLVQQRMKKWEMRVCVDLDVHINGNVLDQDYPIPDRQTIFHNLHGAWNFGKIDHTGAYYQIELDEKAKYICKFNTSQRPFKMYWIPQMYCDLSGRCVGLWNYHGAVWQKMLAVKSRLREKNFSINEKKSNSKPVDSVGRLNWVRILGCSISY